MVTLFHTSIRQSFISNPYRWTAKKIISLFLIGVIAAALLGLIQVSLRYDSNESERWFSYYFFNQLISWGQWIIWAPLLVIFITYSIKKTKSDTWAYLSILVAALGLAFLAATIEGLLWHNFFNTAADWHWRRVWKATLSNRFGIHFLFAFAIMLILAVRQFITITRYTKEVTPLVRNGNGNMDGSLIIKHKGQTEFIPLKEINHLSASGSYVEIFTNTGKTVVTGTLKQFAAQLPAPQFIRIHRSYIVKVDQVKKLTALTNEDYKLLTVQGYELRVSRSYKNALPLLKGST